jgi:hypothetical protein
MGTEGGANLKAIIDTGSEVNLISEKAFKLLIPEKSY